MFFFPPFFPFSLFFNLFGTKQSINCGVVPQFRQLGLVSSPLCSLPGTLTGNLFVRVATHLWAVDTISTAKEGTHLLTVCLPALHLRGHATSGHPPGTRVVLLSSHSPPQKVTQPRILKRLSAVPTALESALTL